MDFRPAIKALLETDSLDHAAQAVVTKLSSSSSVALCRIWLTEDQALRLAGSDGTPLGGGRYARLDGTFGRIPWGEGKIGDIASRGEPFIARSLRGDEDWLRNRDWIARQGIRSFAGYPLVAGQVVLGVLAIFDRRGLTDVDLDELAFVAECAATRLAHLSTPSAPQPLSARAPWAEDGRAAPVPASGWPAPSARVTRADLRALEKSAIAAALGETHGRVFGPRGAARLLGMKPTTLASRIKALGIERVR
ncbi:MAG: GAF domain-containing protein [Acidobacteriota bacterium]